MKCCTKTCACAGRVVTPKAWGEASTLYQDARIEVSRIIACRGGYSSRHLHRHKDNGFLVTRGQLAVIRFDPAGRTAQLLAPGRRLLIVPAGIEHRFVALEDDSVAYEFYWAEPGHAIRADDIVRADLGGRVDGDRLCLDDL